MIDRLPHGMDVAQRLIALRHRIKNDPEGNDVIDLFKRKVLGDHFVIDTEKIFIATQDLAFQLGFIHHFFDVASYGFDIFFTLRL